MPQDVLRAYYQHLLTASKAATDAVDDVESRRTTINGHVDEIRGSWTGPAARSYLPVWDEIDQACGEMLADLRWIADSLTASASAYSDMEGANADALRSVYQREL